MSNSFPFLVRLGLDQSAAASDIRRAYARELKLIDQERDPAGFQLLREAYEVALQWSRRTVRVAEAEPPPAAPPELVPAPQFGVASVPVRLAKPVAAPAAALPERSEPQVDSHALADQVFRDMMVNLGALLHAGEPDLPIVQRLLVRALDDGALLNISARTQFEGLMVRLLAAGWQPGHEVLLVAAARTFDWRTDRRRLADFGSDGARLSRAIDERNMFDAQPVGDISAQRQIVLRLRQDAAPDVGELVRGMRHLDLLVARFPTWLTLVTNVANIRRWRELDQQVPGWRRKLMFEPKVKPVPQVSYESGGKNGSNWWIWLVVVVLLNVGKAVVHDSTSGPPPQAGYEPAAQYIPARTPTAKPSEQQIEAILALVKYKVPPSMRRDELQVEFEIDLDPLGYVSNVLVTDPSRDPGYDAAVAAALRSAPPFPVTMARRFRWYHVSSGASRQAAGRA